MVGLDRNTMVRNRQLEEAEYIKTLQKELFIFFCGWYNGVIGNDSCGVCFVRGVIE